MSRCKVSTSLFIAASLVFALTETSEARADCDYNGNGCDDHPASEGDSDRYASDHEPEVGVGLDLLHTMYGTDSLSGGMFGLRTRMHARLSSRIAIGLGLEQAFGAEKTGFHRYDLAWSLPDFYVYLTPRSKLQLYTVLGVDMRVSHFESSPDQKLADGLPWGYFYMGGSMGAGVESRLSKSTALRFELRGFLRGRIDAQDSRQRIDAAPIFDHGTRTDSGAQLSLGLVFF